MEVKFVLLILLMLSSSVAIANEEEGSEEKKWGPVKTIAVAEGLILVNSYLASLSPEGVGTAMTLLSPLSISYDSSPAMNWVGVGSMASLGLYNALELSDSKYSERDVFKRNLVAWHLTAAALYLTEKYTGKKEPIVSFSATGDSVSLLFHKSF